jgi:hypothetical protein
MSPLLAARIQMGNSLAFHIIFSVLSAGLPLMLCVAEGLALWHKDPVWMAIARRWSKAVALIFVIGAVSGTVISFELGLLWPSYTQFAGAIVGPLFAFEGIFFFVEAIFLGIYLYGWDRLSPRSLALLLPHLDLWNCCRPHHRLGELLDEYAYRLCDAKWATHRHQFLPGHLQPQPALAGGTYGPGLLCRGGLCGGDRLRRRYVTRQAR